MNEFEKGWLPCTIIIEMSTAIQDFESQLIRDLAVNNSSKYIQV